GRTYSACWQGVSSVRFYHGRGGAGVQSPRSWISSGWAMAKGAAEEAAALRPVCNRSSSVDPAAIAAYRGRLRRRRGRPCLGPAEFVLASHSRIRTSIRGAEHAQSRFLCANSGASIAFPRLVEGWGSKDRGRPDWRQPPPRPP